MRASSAGCASSSAASAASSSRAFSSARPIVSRVCENAAAGFARASVVRAAAIERRSSAPCFSASLRARSSRARLMACSAPASAAPAVSARFAPREHRSAARSRAWRASITFEPLSSLGSASYACSAFSSAAVASQDPRDGVPGRRHLPTALLPPGRLRRHGAKTLAAAVRVRCACPLTKWEASTDAPHASGDACVVRTGRPRHAHPSPPHITPRLPSAVISTASVGSNPRLPPALWLAPHSSQPSGTFAKKQALPADSSALRLGSAQGRIHE
jgi:hypothetical protein